MNNKITVFRKVSYFIISLLIATFIFLFVRQSIDNNLKKEINEQEETIEFYEEEFSKPAEKIIKQSEKQIELKSPLQEKISNIEENMKDNNLTIEEQFLEDKEFINEIKNSIEEIEIETINKRSIEIETEEVENFYSIETEIETTYNYSSYIGVFTEEEIDMITNVVMHEVGGIYDSNSFITITYANGISETYYGTCILHKIHAQVLINQYYSSLFPSSLSKCISLYWDPALTNTNYYSKNNEIWKHCREDVIDVIINGSFIPNNVYGATCDSYFAQTFPGYFLYATVFWSTDWYSGTFYYYQYIG